MQELELVDKMRHVVIFAHWLGQDHCWSPAEKGTCLMALDCSVSHKHADWSSWCSSKHINLLYLSSASLEMPGIHQLVKETNFKTLHEAYSRSFFSALGSNQCKAWPSSHYVEKSSWEKTQVYFLFIFCLNNGSHIIKPWAKAHGFIIFEPLFKVYFLWFCNTGVPVPWSHAHRLHHRPRQICWSSCPQKLTATSFGKRLAQSCTYICTLTWDWNRRFSSILSYSFAVEVTSAYVSFVFLPFEGKKGPRPSKTNAARWPASSPTWRGRKKRCIWWAKHHRAEIKAQPHHKMTHRSSIYRMMLWSVRNCTSTYKYDQVRNCTSRCRRKKQRTG